MSIKGLYLFGLRMDRLTIKNLLKYNDFSHLKGGYKWKIL